ncbi:MAG TPA: DUF58 domain-containing protein [Gemmatimonadales bacterium]|jgi:uncharacterized protein (DUF58 family)
MPADYGSLLDSLRGVTWPARRAALAGTAGTHRSRLRGLSAEFTEYRPYRQGDDPRRLDWKLLARTDRAFLRITSDRATLGTVLVVDGSASMAFPERTREKWAQACRIAMGLAAVAHASGDPVGLFIPSDGKPGRVEARTRRGVLAEIARVLDGWQPGGGAPLAPALGLLRGTPRIALIGDFLGDADDALRRGRELSAGGTEVHAIEIVAREELEPPAATFLATDPESPEIRRPLTLDSRDPYLQQFAEWRLTTARAWRAGGATFTEVRTDESAAHAVRRICGLGAGVAAR